MRIQYNVLLQKASAMPGSVLVEAHTITKNISTRSTLVFTLHIHPIIPLSNDLQDLILIYESYYNMPCRLTKRYYN